MIKKASHIFRYGRAVGRLFWVLSRKSTTRSLRWRHDGRDGVSNHQPYDCLLNRLFRRRWKKTSKIRVTGPCVGNSTGEFPAQMASFAENVSIWWRHHVSWRMHYSGKRVSQSVGVGWSHNTFPGTILRYPLRFILLQSFRRKSFPEY